ncbi:activating signal cointegrator 1 isoform X3 [Daktulosphaira vitifoliae]|uniref:activating signal cointegrator 1 isoform X3 n=1 Tax=Daktulosphaira vitifoliae TaxID=58002 RepID=UPI0021A9EC04|nr:activating signal cointegrator 1 isoform X3 [Daktulosphaira vitifoliae]
MSKEEFKQWICNKLSALLQFEVQNEMAEYIFSIQTENDLDEYCNSLLDLKSSVHKQFLSDLKKRFRLLHQSSKNEFMQTNKNKKQTSIKNQNLSTDLGKIPKVCSNDEKILLNCKNNKSKELYNRLIEQTINTQAENEAFEHRNKLLEFDRTSAKRTNVIDDQMDYYSVNSGWLSSEQKDQLKKKEIQRQEKKHGSRRTKKITIDFAGRQVYEKKESDNDEDEELMNDGKETYWVNINEQITNPLMNLDLKFNENCMKKIHRNNINSIYKNEVIKRVQDTELMLMTDPGLCMSMHQPYASLLLLNIKRHEGRSWYTSHRGRLWIASTAKVPTPEEIDRVELFYKNLRGDVEFPKQYPTSCLMGCINITDCLSQEEYMEQYPEGENESPFVFICKDPIMMINNFPIKGSHKIYKLDEKIHIAAQKCLIKQNI